MKILKKYKKLIIKHVIVILVVIAILLVYPECLIKKYFHISCPSCGMTRAIYSLLRFDIKGYFYYNAMAVPAIIAVFLAVHKAYLPLNKKVNTLIVSIISISIFALYIFRIICDKCI